MLNKVYAGKIGIIFTEIVLAFAVLVVTNTTIIPQAEAAQVFCRTSTPNIEGEPAQDSTQTHCIDKKSGTEYFICEGSYAEVGEECGQTFTIDNKRDAQQGIKDDREICRESDDATCEKIKADNP